MPQLKTCLEIYNLKVYLCFLIYVGSCTIRIPHWYLQQFFKYSCIFVTINVRHVILERISHTILFGRKKELHWLKYSLHILQRFFQHLKIPFRVICIELFKWKAAFIYVLSILLGCCWTKTIFTSWCDWILLNSYYQYYCKCTCTKISLFVSMLNQECLENILVNPKPLTIHSIKPIFSFNF